VSSFEKSRTTKRRKKTMAKKKMVRAKRTTKLLGVNMPLSDPCAAFACKSSD